MTKQLLQTDLLVIGGGASGLAAAIAAKRICGDRFSVCIAEQNPRVGKKILVTGNGRCNLGNTSKDYAAYHGSLTAVLPEFLSQTLSSKEFFQTMGLYCHEETDGRLYPHSNQASSVLDTLRLTTEAFWNFCMLQLPHHWNTAKTAYVFRTNLRWHNNSQSGDCRYRRICCAKNRF